MDDAFRFFNCDTETCEKIREQNDHDVLKYIEQDLTDSFMLRQYSTMETHFEEELSTLDVYGDTGMQKQRCHTGLKREATVFGN